MCKMFEPVLAEGGDPYIAELSVKQQTKKEVKRNAKKYCESNCNK